MPTLVFQSCFGPSCGHAADQPVSLEIPLKSVPRQRGQSLAETGTEVSTQKIKVADNTAVATRSGETSEPRPPIGSELWLNMAAQLMDADNGVKH